MVSGRLERADPTAPIVVVAVGGPSAALLVARKGRGLTPGR